MKQLTKENILKNQVNTIEQFKVLDYLKKTIIYWRVWVYLIDRFTIKVVDKNKEQGHFKYNSKQNQWIFMKKILKIKKWNKNEWNLQILKGKYESKLFINY